MRFSIVELRPLVEPRTFLRALARQPVSAQLANKLLDAVPERKNFSSSKAPVGLVTEFHVIGAGRPTYTSGCGIDLEHLADQPRFRFIWHDVTQPLALDGLDV